MKRIAGKSWLSRCAGGLLIASLLAGSTGRASGKTSDQMRIEWMETTPAPDPRAGYSAGQIDGRLVLAGGTYWLGEPGKWTDKVFTPVTDAFDPKTRLWEQLPEAPCPVGYAAGATVGNRLYVMGGVQKGVASNHVMVLSEREGVFEWTAGPALPGPRVFAEAESMESVIYLVGGTTKFEVFDASGLCCLSCSATNTVWALDLSREHPDWEERAVFPGKRRWGHRLVTTGDALYQFGGKFQARAEDSIAWYNEVWRYDPVEDAWAMVAELPLELQGARGVFVDGKILLIGRRGHAATFDPVSHRFAPATPLPEDVIIEYFMRAGRTIVGASGESGTERPRRRSELTYVGRVLDQ